MDRLGQQLGNYRLTHLLGNGGFAEVYLGEHIYLGSQAAIKILHAQLVNNEIEGFLSEARTLISLTHPSIIRLLDFGIQDTIPFLVMDYAPNGTLRQRHLKGERLPLPTVVNYVGQIADALFYAHQQKLIHRDVKPENMLIGKRNEILLSDFGIAVVAQSSRYPRLQEVAGTIAYMAPEQIQSHPCPASDQYALGVVVYEWLSGDTLFHGSFTEIAVKHACVSPPPLREKNPSISSAIEQVVMKALEKDPARRFLDVHAFALALEQASQETWLSSFASGESSQPTILSASLSTILPASQPLLSGVGRPVLEPTMAAGLPVLPSTQKYQREKPARPKYLTFSISLSLLSVLLLIAIIVFSPLLAVIRGGLAASSHSSSASVAGVSSTRTPITPTSTSLSPVPATPSPTVVNPSPTSSSPAPTTPPSIPATPSPTAAVTSPDPYAAGGTLVLNDPLSDNSQGHNWLTGTNQRNAVCEFQGGAYYSIQPAQGFFHSCVAHNTDFSNFAFEVHMTLVSGDYAGIIFCNATDNTYYLFRINTAGSYSLLLFDSPDSEGTPLAKGSISIDLSQANLIGVVVDKGTIGLYVNRQLIRSVSDSTYTHGRIGVLAGNNGDSAEAVFSNAKVWAL